MSDNALSILASLGLTPGDLLSEGELATKLEKKRDTLRNWRSQKRGPRYLKIGGSVKYRALDVAEYLAGSLVNTEAPIREGAR